MARPRWGGYRGHVETGNPEEAELSAESSAAGKGQTAPKSVEELVAEGRDLVPSVLARLEAEGMRGERVDLLAFGQQGLLEAAHRYDPERGDFKRFAYYRVRGAMIDGLRKMGPWTRRGYERISIMATLDRAAEAAEAGGPSLRESAEQAAERLRQHMAAMVTAVTIGVFAETAYDGESVVPKDGRALQDEQLESRQIAASVHEALALLEEPDQDVIRRMYLLGEKLDDIAKDLGCSKSWASRIHTRALKKLGARLKDKLR
jgi:RNA polymerase sigma factor for flagellar operon FliA